MTGSASIVGVTRLGAETWSTPLLLPRHGLIVAADRSGDVRGCRPDGSIRWTARLDGEITGHPGWAERAGVALIGTHAGTLFALDPVDGSVRWSRALGGTIRCAASVGDLSGEVVYVASYGDWLWCLDAATGRVRWRRWLPPHVWVGLDGVVASPLVADVDGDGRLEVVVGTRSWRVYCLDAETGALRWFRGFRYGVDATPTAVPLEDRTLVVLGLGESLSGVGENAIVALDGATGGLAWRHDVGGGVDSPAVAGWRDGRPYVVQTTLADAAAVCLDARTGQRLWRFSFGPTDGCSHESGRCVPRHRRDYFTADAPCRAYAVPLVGDLDGDGDVEVLVASMNGTLHLLDLATGEEKDRFDGEASVRGSPVVADLDGDGRAELVVPAGDRLLVLRIRGTTHWPMFKGTPDLAGLVGDSPPPARRVGASPRAERTRLVWHWAVRDLAWYTAACIDKHVLGRVGRSVMPYWY